MLRNQYTTANSAIVVVRILLHSNFYPDRYQEPLVYFQGPATILDEQYDGGMCGYVLSMRHNVDLFAMLG